MGPKYCRAASAFRILLGGGGVGEIAIHIFHGGDP